MEPKNQNERETPAGTDETAQRLQDATTGIVDQAKSAAETRMSVGVSAASDTLQQTAHAIRQSGQSLREQEQTQVATLADSAAVQVERVAGYLQGTDARQLIGDVEGLARREPVLFLAGGLGLGLLAARLLKSSSAGGDQSASFKSQPSNGESFKSQPFKSQPSKSHASDGRSDFETDLTAPGA